MQGRNYESLEDFKNACFQNNSPLEPEYVLAKVYTIDQLRNIVTETGLRLNENETVERGGIGKRYDLSKKVAELVTPEELGRIISKLDHNCYFHYLSYTQMTDIKAYLSKEAFIEKLHNQDIHIEDNFKQMFNGIKTPRNRRCSLESISISESENQISMVYSCTRILTIPDSKNSYDFNNMFLARIPLIVRLYFDHRLIEFSVPYFTEPIVADFGYSNTIPKRFQLMIDSVIYHFRNNLGLTLGAINLDNFLLYLETLEGVEDMGWKILPQNTATFDLKQGFIPLKSILDAFSENLRHEINRRGINRHALSDINLYELFRALKEQSYTHTMVLKVPYGIRGGTFLLTVINGEQNSENLPIVTVNNNNDMLSNFLRDSILSSQQTTIQNPYNFDSLFSHECQN